MLSKVTFITDDRCIDDEIKSILKKSSVFSSPPPEDASDDQVSESNVKSILKNRNRRLSDVGCGGSSSSGRLPVRSKSESSVRPILKPNESQPDQSRNSRPKKKGILKGRSSSTDGCLRQSAVLRFEDEENSYPQESASILKSNSSLGLNIDSDYESDGLRSILKTDISTSCEDVSSEGILRACSADQSDSSIRSILKSSVESSSEDLRDLDSSRWESGPEDDSSVKHLKGILKNSGSSEPEKSVSIQMEPLLIQRGILRHSGSLNDLTTDSVHEDEGVSVLPRDKRRSILKRRSHSFQNSTNPNEYSSSEYDSLHYRPQAQSNISIQSLDEDEQNLFLSPSPRSDNELNSFEESSSRPSTIDTSTEDINFNQDEYAIREPHVSFEEPMQTLFDYDCQQSNGAAYVSSNEYSVGAFSPQILYDSSDLPDLSNEQNNISTSKYNESPSTSANSHIIEDVALENVNISSLKHGHISSSCEDLHQCEPHDEMNRLCFKENCHLEMDVDTEVAHQCTPTNSSESTLIFDNGVSVVHTNATSAETMQYSEDAGCLSQLVESSKATKARRRSKSNRFGDNSSGIDLSQRRRTQPITSIEMSQTLEDTEQDTSNLSISERLKLLSSKSDDWKSRGFHNREVLREKDRPITRIRSEGDRPVSIADIKSQLHDSGETWKNRVSKDDEDLRSISSVDLWRSQSENRHNNARKTTTMSKGDRAKRALSLLNSPVIPLRTVEETSPKPITKSTIAPPVQQPSSSNRQVSVSKVDNGLNSFFSSSEPPQKESISLNVDLDAIFDDENHSKGFVVDLTAKPRVNRAKRPKSSNPLKKEIPIVVDAYEESLSKSSATASTKYLDKLAARSTLAQSALAGLASSENISAVKLAKMEETRLAHRSRPMQSFTEKMLLLVKGSRRVQVRLIEPSARSLTDCDCFVFINGSTEKVWLYLGKFSSTGERSRAVEVARQVIENHDLGATWAKQSILIDERAPHPDADRMRSELINELGGDEGFKITAGGNPEDDDIYFEEVINVMTRVYEVQGKSLIVRQDLCCRQPSISCLQPDLVFIFDFGSEVYLWLGSKANAAERKAGAALLRQVWSDGFDFTDLFAENEFKMSPLNPLDPKAALSCCPRPTWTISGKLCAHMETVLFASKFVDWPEDGRYIRAKTYHQPRRSISGPVEMEPVHPVDLLRPHDYEQGFVIDDVNVGRGDYYTNPNDRFHSFQVTSLSVTSWPVVDGRWGENQSISRTHLFDEEACVLKWCFEVERSGIRKLKGISAQRTFRTTRAAKKRSLFFFWQGSNCSVQDMGTSALATIELDREGASQVRVLQGKEPACFLRLFGGQLIIHMGKREHLKTRIKEWRMFFFQACRAEEAVFIELKTSRSSLRSKGCFLLLNAFASTAVVIIGCKATLELRTLLQNSLKKLQNLGYQDELGMDIGKTQICLYLDESDVDSDMCPTSLKSALGTASYDCMVHDKLSRLQAPRMFALTSILGSFSSEEVICQWQDSDGSCHFPFTQQDLYGASQPALFLVDSGASEVYLWEGWIPDEKEEALHTGSINRRFDLERTCAMKTAINYCEAKRARSGIGVNSYLILSGVEPSTFTNLFPVWKRNTAVYSTRKKADKRVRPLREELECILNSQYSLDRLKEYPLPANVDSNHLEFYLSDEDFFKAFQMCRNEYYAMPGWKQQALKQKIALF